MPSASSTRAVAALMFGAIAGCTQPSSSEHLRLSCVRARPRAGVLRRGTLACSDAGSSGRTSLPSAIAGAETAALVRPSFSAVRMQRARRRVAPRASSTILRPMSTRRPYCTPDGHVVSQLRQVRQRSRCELRRARDLLALEHLLHQVDAAARAVELVAEQLVGRAGGRAEAAVHALAQDGVGLPALRRVADEVGEVRSAWQRLCVQAAGVEDAGRVECGLQSSVDRRQRGRQRMEHAQRLVAAAEQRRVAAGGRDARRGSSPPAASDAHPAQRRRPTRPALAPRSSGRGGRAARRGATAAPVAGRKNRAPARAARPRAARPRAPGSPPILRVRGLHAGRGAGQAHVERAVAPGGGRDRQRLAAPLVARLDRLAPRSPRDAASCSATGRGSTLSDTSTISAERAERTGAAARDTS